MKPDGHVSDARQGADLAEPGVVPQEPSHDARASSAAGRAPRLAVLSGTPRNKRRKRGPRTCYRPSQAANLAGPGSCPRCGCRPTSPGAPPGRRDSLRTAETVPWREDVLVFLACPRGRHTTNGAGRGEDRAMRRGTPKRERVRVDQSTGGCPGATVQRKKKRGRARQGKRKERTRDRAGGGCPMADAEKAEAPTVSVGGTQLRRPASGSAPVSTTGRPLLSLSLSPAMTGVRVHPRAAQLRKRKKENRRNACWRGNKLDDLRRVATRPNLRAPRRAVK
ncbi:hypothetical protein VTK73DRAFT_3562 [Phialemonium thermophilum]|uniref:Uncharacterized protein n=1 Tax=Phialemonium thermophilum TaxID=223376 RepID=A0ABR3VIQ9_9PEZI